MSPEASSSLHLYKKALLAEEHQMKVEDVFVAVRVRQVQILAGTTCRYWDPPWLSYY